MENQNQQKVQIKVKDEDLKGNYANMAQLGHTKEEFILDFFMVHPPAGTLASRVITSPGHAKRLLGALQTNIENYEKKFGKIEKAEAPKGGNIGFQSE
ncbi:MAG: DUF3467 domain-containing protein [Candidatus Spechtbacterales bacterium]